MKVARESFGVENFFIEPEEVKTFAEIAKNNPEQFIKAQENVIAKLQEQLLKSGNSTQSTQIQIENSFLKQKISILEVKNTQFLQKLESKETNTVVQRDFNNFKARILDLPLRQTMQPLFENFPEFEQLVSSKVCTEFPLLLYKLQQDIIDMAFQRKYEGVEVVQRTHHYGGDVPTNIFLLQINMKSTDMPDDQILSFYHNGMIDYLEFNLGPRTEVLLNKFGEKFILTAGNMASHTDNPMIGCKIFASFPEADSHTYRPARKRILISHHKEEQTSLKGYACSQEYTWWDNINSKETLQLQIEKMIIQGQKTPTLPAGFFNRPWGKQYRLVAEGHYIQIFVQTNWTIILPFIGEDDSSPILILNTEEDDYGDDGTDDPGSPPSIDSNYRDF